MEFVSSHLAITSSNSLKMSSIPIFLSIHGFLRRKLSLQHCKSFVTMFQVKINVSFIFDLMLWLLLGALLI